MDILKQEQKRLQVLESYSISDSTSETIYDDIAQIASEITQSPIAQINIIDGTQQYSKSSFGLPPGIVPREFAFCNQTIKTPFSPTLVPDMRLDTRFKDHPAVVGDPHIQFYLGIPLTTQDGFALGSLCVMDHKPRQLSYSQQETLKSLASQVVVNFELKRSNNMLRESQIELKTKYDELEKFAYIVSHDLKSPLNNIISLVQILKNDYRSKLDADGIQLLEYLTASSAKLKNLVDGILEFYRGDNLLAGKKEDIDLNVFLTGIARLNDPLNLIQFCYPENSTTLTVNVVALEQIFLNLIGNAIKYNDKEKIVITVTFSQDDEFYHFTVQDNGMGIPEENYSDIFQLFNNLNQKDRDGNLGSGIGLSTVKKLVEKSDGKISLTSAPGQGTTFSFSIRQ